MSFTFLNQLPTPAEIKRDYALSAELAQLKSERDTMIANVLKGMDDRFLVIIGPCSADNEDSVCGILYNGIPYYFIKNLQGDVIAIVDKDSETVAKYSYDAWGVPTIKQDT